MKIISWNVNGVRAVQSKGFAETLALLDADCILLQET
ncbi:MAG: exodeoxyribonuclease III, partial [Methylobacter sp.]